MRQFFSRKVLLLSGLGIVLLTLILGIGLFYYHFEKAQKQILGIQTNPQIAAQVANEDKQKLISEVGDLIELPVSETPTIATISDISKLKNQPFFKNAKNGDRLLIYPKSKKAYLYDPNIHKLVEVASLDIATPPEPASVLSSVILENGTKFVGLTFRYESELKKVYPNVNVVSKINASKNNYKYSLLIPLTSEAKNNISDIAKKLGLKVSDLPEGESKPKGADYMIILGNDSIQ